MPDQPDGSRKRSTTLVIALCAALLIIGIFVAGYLVGNASTSPPTPVTTTSTTTATSTKPESGTAGFCDELATRCAITSGTGDTVVAGAPFSFTVTTSGSPVPSLRRTGRLPKGVHFVNNHDGTATLFGSPTSTRRRSAVGSYPLVFTATFSRGDTKLVATQEFTLTVS